MVSCQRMGWGNFIRTNVLSSGRRCADPVCPALHTIPECQRVVVLADNLSTSSFNGRNGALARSRSDDVNWRLEFRGVLIR